MSTPTPAPFNVFIDSDGPVADFDKDFRASGLSAEKFKHLPGAYLWLSVTPGADRALRILKEFDDRNMLRVWIATKTPSNSPYAYTEKVLWYRRNFPWLEDRVILTHDKHLLGQHGDYLLDDRPHKANADKFRGIFTYFDVGNPDESWEIFLKSVTTRMTLSDLFSE